MPRPMAGTLRAGAFGNPGSSAYGTPLGLTYGAWAAVTRPRLTDLPAYALELERQGNERTWIINSQPAFALESK